MLNKLKTWLLAALPIMKTIANLLINSDENETGFDDKAGQFIMFAITALEAILSSDEQAFDNAKMQFVNDELKMPVEPVL